MNGKPRDYTRLAFVASPIDAARAALEVLA